MECPCHKKYFHSTCTGVTFIKTRYANIIISVLLISPMCGLATTAPDDAFSQTVYRTVYRIARDLPQFDLSAQPNDALQIPVSHLSKRGSVQLTISKVQTRRIHTFRLPSIPSTPFKSTPSHQHLLAGFRQKSRSFCAIPTALLPARSPLMSVRNLARARLQITALFGSPALWPQQSSWSNPLCQVRSSLDIIQGTT